MDPPEGTIGDSRQSLEVQGRLEIGNISLSSTTPEGENRT